MPVYEYRCPLCGTEGQQMRPIEHRDHDPLNPTSPQLPRCPGCNVPMVRKYSSIAFHRSMPEHYNATLGRHISTKHEFREGLKIASEEATARTGMDHNFVEVDMTDTKALGVTEEGMDETYRRQTDAGIRPRQLWL